MGLVLLLGQRICEGLAYAHTATDESHRALQLVHRDLSPANVCISYSGEVKIIDFGSAKIAGVVEAAPPVDHEDILGTVQYTAPEYFFGEGGTPRSDLFSLGVITYQMLTGKLPYGAQVAKLRRKAELRHLKYNSAFDNNREIPAWIDSVIEKSIHPEPNKRYDSLSEFMFDLRYPNEKYLNSTRLPLLDRNPLLFWKCLSVILACIILFLLINLRRS